MTLQVCLFEEEKERREDITKHGRKVCGVVKARVTSINRLWVRIPPTTKVAVAQWQSRKHPEPLIPDAKEPMW